MSAHSLQAPQALQTAPLAGWHVLHLIVLNQVSKSFQLPGSKLAPNGVSSCNKGINRHIMFPLSTPNICWTQRGLLAMSSEDTLALLCTLLFVMHQETQTWTELLKDGFTWKSGNCLQGIPPSIKQRSVVSISGSGTFPLSLVSTCSHPTGPTPREMDTAE